MPIVNRQTVIIYRNLAGEVQQFYKAINLDFEPTSFIVKQIDYLRTTGAEGLHAILVPFTNAKDNLIATFVSDTTPDAYTANPDSQFIINHPSMLFNGDVLFRVRKLRNTIEASTAEGIVSLTLEFIREVYPEPSASVSQMSQLIQTLTDMTRPTDIYPFDNIDETKSQPARVETPEPTGRIADLQALEERQAQEGGQDEKKVDDITVKTKPRPI
jgi:hypothetical protein